MRYYPINRRESIRLVAEEKNFFDLTATKPEFTVFVDIARASSITDRALDDIANRLLEEAVEVDASEVMTERMLPLVADEVWAAGVTYEISEQACESESRMLEIYLDIYDVERPEIFFKTTPSRTVGPEEDISVREDSE